MNNNIKNVSILIENRYVPSECNNSDTMSTFVVWPAVGSSRFQQVRNHHQRSEKEYFGIDRGGQQH